MQGVVLVGGFGTRLRPLTNSMPKPMLPIGHLPMIERLINRLARGGVTDVVLALGFKPEPFMEAFPDGMCGDVRLTYAVEPEPLDTGGAIAFAAREANIDSTFVVANGDVMTDLDVGALVAAHRSSGDDATLHLTAVDDPSAFGVVDIELDGNRAGPIRQFVEKPERGTEPSNLINAGTYVFEPSVLDLIPAGERLSIERDTFPKLVAAGSIGGYATHDCYWIDAGTPDLYRAANLDLLAGRRTTESCEAYAPDAEVDPSATVSNTLVGAGAVIEGGTTTVVDSVILPGAFIGAGAQVESSLVMGRIEGEATIIESIIGADGVVPDGDHVAFDTVPEV